LDFVNFGGFRGFRFLDPPFAVAVALVIGVGNPRCDETPRARTALLVDVSLLRQFAPLDVFNVSSLFPAYSVKTQACISVRIAHGFAVQSFVTPR